MSTRPSLKLRTDILVDRFQSVLLDIKLPTYGKTNPSEQGMRYDHPYRNKGMTVTSRVSAMWVRWVVHTPGSFDLPSITLYRRVVYHKLDRQFDREKATRFE